MKGVLKKDITADQHTGYLGTSRVVLNHFDVSTQADIQHQALNYGSEDEIMGRLYGQGRRRESGPAGGSTLYSKQDIREQYCISERGLGALENSKQSIFGCISSHHSSPCSTRSASSLLTACVKQKVSSDENLYELYKRHPSEYAPFPKRQRYPWMPLTPEIYRHDIDLKSSYFRRKPQIDPSRYTWMPSDDESIRMEKPKSILDSRNQMPSMQPNQAGKKHVSFARSHTLTSFDDAMSSLTSSSSHLNRITRSQERLLEVKIAEDAITKQPELSENVVILDKIKRAPMKTQATQTDVGLGRKPITPGNLHLSPRTIQKVKMVSQAAQTNGYNGRKLAKSLSEAGNKLAMSPKKEFSFFDPASEHEPLQRTQSDEPPRSPFFPITPPQAYLPPENPPQSESSSLSKSEEHESEDSVESKQEIFIDFKPQVPPGRDKMVKRPLVKTASDGVILVEKRKNHKDEDSVVPNLKKYNSISHENIQVVEERRPFTPYFQKAPIRNEGICKPLEENIYSSTDGCLFTQDSIDEEFHENFIFNKNYINRQDSQNSSNVEIGKCVVFQNDESVVPSISLRPDMKLSPFTSNDDIRDQSDGNWNESQVTVLQVDSGTDNGTPFSSSEVVSLSSPVAINLLTPSSRRKELLILQHQQRSSMDIETLDEELGDQPTQPQIVVDKLSTKLEVPTPLSPNPKHSPTLLKVGHHRSSALISRQKRTESPPVVLESPLPAVVPDLLLARTDSCKTNTDVSESTTTDDYITANSGTDSSKKSGSLKELEKQVVQQQQQAFQKAIVKAGVPDTAESSFDSAKGSMDTFMAEDMVVPSVSPSYSPKPPSESSSISRKNSSTPLPQIISGRSTPSDDSSSCGSYSVGASIPDLLDSRYSIPSGSPNKTWQGSEDEERSVHYSSSGYYESPIEDDFTLKSSRHEDYTRSKKRRDFHLELTHTSKPQPSSKNKQKYGEAKNTPEKENHTKLLGEKLKRTKSRTRSPMQGQKKNIQGRRSPYKEKNAAYEEKNYKATSDESSTGREYAAGQNSPRKSKKSKDNNRRRSLPRSPIRLKTDKRSSAEYQPSSLPGSLCRRKSFKQSKSLQSIHLDGKKTGSKSPIPQKNVQNSSKETATLKALSAESLRSVSPGSDSVFYSDPSSHTTDHQIHCLHCGKEVDVITDEAEKSLSSSEPQPDIVQPPAGFADSPKLKPGRLFKKVDKRIRSEERSQAEGKRNKYKPDARAKKNAAVHQHQDNTLLHHRRPTAQPSPQAAAAAPAASSCAPAPPTTTTTITTAAAAAASGGSSSRRPTAAPASCRAPPRRRTTTRESTARATARAGGSTSTRGTSCRGAGVPRQPPSHPQTRNKSVGPLYPVPSRNRTFANGTKPSHIEWSIENLV